MMIFFGPQSQIFQIFDEFPSSTHGYRRPTPGATYRLCTIVPHRSQRKGSMQEVIEGPDFHQLQNLLKNVEIRWEPGSRQRLMMKKKLGR